ncbi:MAG TPA: BON domain-containing protein [Verrucomicrobiae bacterium]|nr:BON domain-containing protein [Verrucomicrobiae bacterium]
MKSLIMAGGLGLATVATFTGCATGDRSTGQYIDDRMTARRVKTDLKSNPIFKFDEVSVNAYRGVVQLNGWVTQPEQKQIAERIAKSTPGVLDVVNNLSMKPQFQLVPAGQTSTGGTSSDATQHQGTGSQQEQRTQDQIDRQQQQQNQNQP